MSFFNLPDVCLFIIFDNLPLPDLLRIHLINAQWILVQQSALRRRRTLVLVSTSGVSHIISKSFLTLPYAEHLTCTTVDGSTGPLICAKDRIEWSVFESFPLTRQVAHWLANTLPNIE